MDDVFKELEKAGKTDVENLVQWMKDSKVIETLKDEQTRALFQDVVDDTRVELDTFKDILVKVATDQAKTVEQLSDQLAAAVPKVIDAAAVGLKAFKEALKE